MLQVELERLDWQKPLKQAMGSFFLWKSNFSGNCRLDSNLISFVKARYYRCIRECKFFPTLNKFTLHYITLEPTTWSYFAKRWSETFRKIHITASLAETFFQ